MAGPKHGSAVLLFQPFSTSAFQDLAYLLPGLAMEAIATIFPEMFHINDSFPDLKLIKLTTFGFLSWAP